VTTRKRDKQVEAKPPRADAPEHPVDPADAAFLDPAAVTRAATAAPSTTDEDVPGTPGYGDFEGERASRDRAGAGGPGKAGRHAGSGTDRHARDRKAGR
jgi:hypothetical protein